MLIYVYSYNMHIRTRNNICILQFLIFHSCSTYALEEEVVRVQLIKRIGRSAIADYDYEVLVHTAESGTKHRLQLRAAEAILSPHFKYHEIDVNEAGRTIFRDATPAPRRLREIQKGIYIDSRKNTAVRLKRTDGNFELEGLVNGLRMRRQNGEHLIETPGSVPKPTSNQSDYLDFHRPMSQPRGMLMSKVLKATPEVAVVFDYANSKQFDFDANKILEYITILFNAVNNRYSLNEDPKITIQLVGVHAIKSPDAQPFIGNSNRAPDGKRFLVGEVERGYNKWVFENANLLPKYDIVPLITGIEFDGPIGIAPLNGACWLDAKDSDGTMISAAAPVTQDVGGLFRGSFTVAHELAHNMGSPHDGEGDSASCPWADGDLMSYEGWGTEHKFHLSKCSQKAMKKFLASSGGTCLILKNQGVKVVTPSKVQAGDIVDMHRICVAATGDPVATVMFEQNPDESCRNVKCKFGRNQILLTKSPADDNSPCGEGGKCQFGVCVGQTKSDKLLSMDELCVKLTDNKGARALFEDPDIQCSRGFKCKTDAPGNSYYTTAGVKPKEGTACGDRGTCRNGTCSGQKMLTMDEICVKITEKQNARTEFADPNIQCQKGFRCFVDAEQGKFYTVDGKQPKDGTPCGNGGKCENKSCAGNQPWTTKQICEKMTGTTTGLEFDSDYDGLCATLKCKFPAAGTNGGWYLRFATGQTPNGTLCGKKYTGACQNGKCVGQ